MPAASLHLSGDPPADALLSKDPLALLIGMILDQQVPLEKAFHSPYELRERLGGKFDAGSLATMDPDKLIEIFAARPALHRFPRSMAGRVQSACQMIVDSYGGDTAALWTTAEDGKQLMANLTAIPGFGTQKARIFAALLGKQLGIRPSGWREASAPYGEPDSFRSVADIVSPESLAKVRAFKQAAKAKARREASASA
jgi:uncharacterized HhH-GPD family protein